MENLQPLGFFTAMELPKNGLFTHNKLSSMLQIGHNFSPLTAFLKVVFPPLQDLFWKSHQR